VKGEKRSMEKNKTVPIDGETYLALELRAKEKGFKDVDSFVHHMLSSKMAETIGKTDIEYEEVNLQIPKAIMEFLRDSEKSLGETATSYLERSLVDMVRGDIDSRDCFVPTPREIAERYNLDPVFKQITGISVDPAD
jgi:hypothetical protein